MSDQWNDRQLVEALLKRDPRAVEFFFGEAYCAPIVRTLSHRFHFDCQDFFQDFAVRVMDRDWRCLRMWEGRSTLKSYLWSVAIHYCYELSRLKKRELPTFTLTDCDDSSEKFRDKGQLDAPTTLENKEDRAKLLRFIEMLPERDRLMLYMRSDHCTIPEIAERFGLSLEATRTALFRARERLNEIRGGVQDHA